MPVTYVTMLIATLAIAGVPPFAGFFSKDEILYRSFLDNRLLWGLGAITALLTAFYMFRLMSMTFYGGYRGQAFGEAAHDAAHGPDAAHGGGHGHGAWHGPHESPKVMTIPLMALAVGAIVTGFLGVPAALGGNNAIESYLEPSFTASAAVHGAAVAGETAAAEPAAAAEAETPAHGEEGAHLSLAGEWGLMLFSVLLAVIGIWLAYRFYVTRPEISEGLAARYPGPHRVLLNKYYVDELYDATAVRGTLGSARGLWAFDRGVVDGAVNGSGWLTRFSAWLSNMFDKYVVDGLVNLVGWLAGEGSYVLRRVQTGLIQNYALLMLFGVFAFLTLYLFTR